MGNVDKIMELSLKEGFADAKIIETSKIIFDPSFRPYCEEDLCGHYGKNYSCPPDCGTPEEMKGRVLAHQKALVLRTIWDIRDLTDEALINNAKREHNAGTIRLMDRLKEMGHQGFMVGASGCALCSPCRLRLKEPCPFPGKKYSCLSAYCIYVKDLAEKCGMVYDYQEGALPLFSLLAFD